MILEKRKRENGGIFLIFDWKRMEGIFFGEWGGRGGGKGGFFGGFWRFWGSSFLRKKEGGGFFWGDFFGGVFWVLGKGGGKDFFATFLGTRNFRERKRKLKGWMDGEGGIN
jgi:hypothetical protein